MTPEFSEGFRNEFIKLLTWRRDVREFKTDPLPPETFQQLVHLSSLAPSVGLSQPWRFVLVEDEARRKAIRGCFEECNAEALALQTDDRAALYARLKLSGLDKAPLQFAMCVDDDTEQGHRLGRRTMPETTSFSAVTALFTIWLAARVDGIGLGWVSILDPKMMLEILDVPPSWSFLGYFCMGYPDVRDDTPALQRLGWERRHDESEQVLLR